MSILGFLAWGVYGALAIDDARQNKKYTNHSYQLAVKEGRDFYYDQRGRTYYVPTGEEIVITRNEKKEQVYLKAGTNYEIRNLTKEKQQKYIDEAKAAGKAYCLVANPKDGYNYYEIATGRHFYRFQNSPAIKYEDDKSIVSLSDEEYIELGGHIVKCRF